LGKYVVQVPVTESPETFEKLQGSRSYTLSRPIDPLTASVDLHAHNSQHANKQDHKFCFDFEEVHIIRVQSPLTSVSTPH